ncbi:MAG TPA: hypothetical protein VGF45_20990 [Polyangia bacterium]
MAFLAFLSAGWSRTNAKALLGRALLSVAMCAVGAACNEGLGETKACTLIGCQDQASIVVRTSDGLTPPMGVVLDLDGVVVRCMIPPPTGFATGLCNDPRVEVARTSLTDCQDTNNGSTSSRSCVPNGKFEQIITVRATPARIGVQLLDHAQVIAERTFASTYTLSFPNGPGCEPGCRQARHEWTLPPP